MENDMPRKKSTEEETPETVEEGAAETAALAEAADATSASPEERATPKVTLTKAQQERLRRKLQAKYH